MSFLSAKIISFIIGIIAIVILIRQTIVTTPQNKIFLPIAPVVLIDQTRSATSTKQDTPQKLTPPEKKLEVKIATTAILKREVVAEKEPLLDIEKLNTLVRGSVINIFCTTKSGGDLRPLSGSGIIISKNGIILTNAHIGQYFLIRDYKVKDFLTCVGRTGSPAYPEYKLELVYLPDEWLTENAEKINDENPLSTGENDYAFVVITGSTSGRELSNIDNLPYLEGETKDMFAPKDSVMLAAYPAGFLGGIIIQKDLWLVSSISTISKLFYFNNPEKIDLFTVHGNIISQKGASGGAVVSLNSGKLLGIITTATTNTKTTSERELSVLTFPYIKSQFEKNSGKTLETFLLENPADLISDFDNTSRAGLSEKLTKVLDK